MELQNTIKKEAVVSGIALHTGVRANLRILPAPENTGIVFRRIDMPGKPAWYKTGDMARFFIGEHVENVTFSK